MSKLAAIIEEFQDLDASERLDLLLDFAEKLPELPEAYQAKREAGLHRVPECMTPTFLWVQCISGRVSIHAYVAPEAPTVKGFVSILVEAFNGTRPDEVATAPVDLLHRLGLAELLGMNRLRGLNAVQQRLKNQIGKAAVLAVDV
jgi:cysteine desulfuration protein SufE